MIKLKMLQMQCIVLAVQQAIMIPMTVRTIKMAPRITIGFYSSISFGISPPAIFLAWAIAELNKMLKVSLSPIYAVKTAIRMQKMNARTAPSMTVFAQHLIDFCFIFTNGTTINNFLENCNYNNTKLLYNLNILI